RLAYPDRAFATKAQKPAARSDGQRFERPWVLARGIVRACCGRLPREGGAKTWELGDRSHRRARGGAGRSGSSPSVTTGRTKGSSLAQLSVALILRTKNEPAQIGA